MKFKIRYTLEGDNTIHTRYYTALDPSTARYMFEETVTEGSLCGSSPTILGIYKLSLPRWKKVSI